MELNSHSLLVMFIRARCNRRALPARRTSVLPVVAQEELLPPGLAELQLLLAQVPSIATSSKTDVKTDSKDVKGSDSIKGPKFPLCTDTTLENRTCEGL